MSYKLNRYPNFVETLNLAELMKSGVMAYYSTQNNHLP